MPKTDSDTRRCQQCRYWFERCCHALALLEGDNHEPCRCHHFATEAIHLFAQMERRP
jgi:hypothetical protein